METGRPAVGDIFYGPIAREPLVALAVPARRDGKSAYLLLALFETRQFQARIEEVALPSGWVLSLFDGKGDFIARQAPPGWNPDIHAAPAKRFVTRSSVSPWSVVLEIPRDLYYTGLLQAVAALVLVVFGATLVSVLGGTWSGRRLGRAVAALSQPAAPGAAPADIVEIAEAREFLDAAKARREHAEAEIRRINADLERRVAERTAELTAANQELDAFAYAVSHDLRAPLRAMRGFSRALREDCRDRLEGDGANYLERIDLASRRMGELIDGLLTLSRAARGEIQREPLDLTSMATQLLAELERDDPGRPRTTEVQGGLLARGDPRMIEAALRNLLGNAWKFTARTAEPRIKVYAEQRGGQRWYCIADNGAGFDPALAGQLFQAFRRLHGQEEFPGIGVGLATVHRIVRHHGGEVQARGEPGRGAVFCFSLPEGD